MDPIANPYAPGAGSPPPELAGRDDIIAAGTTALGRVAAGRPTQSLILAGLRGVGKTVLLNKLLEIAEIEGFSTIYIEAHEGKSLPELLIPGLRALLYKFSGVDAAKELARRGLRALKGFVNALSIKIDGVEYGLSIDPEPGVADSGDLEADLPELILLVAQAAKAANRPVVIFVDEMQYLSAGEFSALIMSLHRINQRQLPLTMIGAGLPQILGLAGQSKSYAERLFRYPEIGPLDGKDAEQAVRKPAGDEGVEFDDAAVASILEITGRYPYFIQQWAYETWNRAEGSPISLADVTAATKGAIEELDQSFFKVRFDRCTPAEKKYMRALAELGEGPHRSGDVAAVLKVKVQSVAPTRSSLIKKGMIYSPAHGDTAFTVPLFDEYMRRAVPSMDAAGFA